MASAFSETAISGMTSNTAPWFDRSAVVLVTGIDIAAYKHGFRVSDNCDLVILKK